MRKEQIENSFSLIADLNIVLKVRQGLGKGKVWAEISILGAKVGIDIGTYRPQSLSVQRRSFVDLLLVLHYEDYELQYFQLVKLDKLDRVEREKFSKNRYPD